MDREPFLKSGLITLFASLSVTTAFAATGFIAAVGREQFLGFNVTDWSAQTLTILASRCAVDSFFGVLNLAAIHWELLVLCIVLIAAGAILLRRRQFPLWVAPAAECAVAVPLLIWVLVVVVTFEAPTVPMRGWIVASSFESPLDLAISQMHLQAAPGPHKPSRAASPSVSTIENYLSTKNIDTPGILLLESSSDYAGQLLSTRAFTHHSQMAANKLLDAGYAKAIVACALALLYVVLTRKFPKSRIWTDVLVVLRTAIIIASSIGTVLIPYTYGKVIDPALFPDAYISYTEPRPNFVDPDLRPWKGGDPMMHGGEFPLISQTDRSIFLLWVQLGAGYTKLIEVPRDRIVSINLVGDVDALAKISECKSNVQSAGCQI